MTFGYTSRSFHFRFAFMPSRFPHILWSAFVQEQILAAVCGVFAGFFACAVIAAPGQLDATFGVGGRSLIQGPTATSSSAGRALIQPDGRVVVAGTCRTTQIVYALCLWRFLPNGASDPSFATSGQVVSQEVKRVVGLFLDITGELIVLTNCSWTDVCVHRFLANGLTDISFGINGVARIAFNTYNVQPLGMTALRASTGAFLVVAKCERITLPSSACIIKITPSGLLDTSFGSGGQTDFAIAAGDFPFDMAKLVDDTFIIGALCRGTAQAKWCVGRFNSQGQILSGSNLLQIPLSVNVGVLSALAPLNDGGVLLIGGCTVGNQYQNIQFCAARLIADLSIDFSYASGGVFRVSMGEADANPISALTDGNGGVVLVGTCAERYSIGNSLTTVDRFCAIKMDANGSIVSTFGAQGTSITNLAPGTFNSNRPSFALRQGDGKYWIGGHECSSASGLCMIRLKGGPYSPLTCALNADANQTIDPATDALLLTRYLLGYRGEALTTGALGKNPTRTGQALEDYLASLNLDVDGDGQALAMTDGLLMLRAMLGLTGDALTQGATNASHPNVRNAQQILTWIENTHGVACLP